MFERRPRVGSGPTGTNQCTKSGGQKKGKQKRRDKRSHPKEKILSWKGGKAASHMESRKKSRKKLQHLGQKTAYNSLDSLRENASSAASRHSPYKKGGACLMTQPLKQKGRPKRENRKRVPKAPALRKKPARIKSQISTERESRHHIQRRDGEKADKEFNRGGGFKKGHELNLGPEE